ncbi:DMT family transporter [Paucibacter sp. PLA-PC-4]|uniref:DMT family transporter n=1 Tax=Paucibacter sp. PLA-PC-4 TaxID=2993655 RepID=UPI002249969A|nr:DMT family transporter [Paucibacter sp. PLA-PC-4]MCX2862686.1 DMT family transporter [Paucibacter sp. PLA-PC-4]
MPGSALALVLAAALLHAIWNLGAKKADGNHHFVLASALAVSLLWAPLALYLGWDELPRWSLTAWLAVLLSAVLHLLYFNALLAGYRASDLSIVYPVARGSGPALSAMAAVLIFGERLGLAGTLGLLGVVGGIVLIAAGPGLWRRGDQQSARRRSLGLAWGALTGALICAYTVVDAYSVKVLLLSPLLLDWLCNVLRVPFALPQVLRDASGFMPALRRQWPYVLLMAVCSPLAYILVLYAMQMAPLSRVAPMRELSMLIAALLGGQLLKEDERHWRLLGAGCIAGGVIALAL